MRIYDGLLSWRDDTQERITIIFPHGTSREDDPIDVYWQQSGSDSAAESAGAARRSRIFRPANEMAKTSAELSCLIGVDMTLSFSFSDHGKRLQGALHCRDGKRTDDLSLEIQFSDHSTGPSESYISYQDNAGLYFAIFPVGLGSSCPALFLGRYTDGLGDPTSVHLFCEQHQCEGSGGSLGSNALRCSIDDLCIEWTVDEASSKSLMLNINQGETSNDTLRSWQVELQAISISDMMSPTGLFDHTTTVVNDMNVLVFCVIAGGASTTNARIIAWTGVALSAAAFVQPYLVAGSVAAGVVSVLANKWTGGAAAVIGAVDVERKPEDPFSGFLLPRESALHEASGGTFGATNTVSLTKVTLEGGILRISRGSKDDCKTETVKVSNLEFNPIFEISLPPDTCLRGYRTCEIMGLKFPNTTHGIGDTSRLLPHQYISQLDYSADPSDRKTKANVTCYDKDSTNRERGDDDVIFATSTDTSVVLTQSLLDDPYQTRIGKFNFPPLHKGKLIIWLQDVFLRGPDGGGRTVGTARFTSEEIMDAVYQDGKTVKSYCVYYITDRGRLTAWTMDSSIRFKHHAPSNHPDGKKTWSHALFMMEGEEVKQHISKLY